MLDEHGESPSFDLTLHASSTEADAGRERQEDKNFKVNLGNLRLVSGM